jgi:membrane fusion protein (multidrug efflux system)
LWLVSLLGVLGVAEAAERSVLVATRPIEPVAHDLTLPEKLGLLEAGQHRALAFEVPGRVASMAPEGVSVAAGDVIAELDNDLERAQLRQAGLHLREARSELKRVRNLRASNVASEKALESAQTLVEVRIAERDARREQLERRIVIAPFQGIVAETRFEPGEVVSPGTPALLFMDLSELRLELGVPGYQVDRVREGARVFLWLPALPGVEVEGAVVRVAPAAAEGRHLFEVEIRVPNSEGRLRPGMSARARIVTRSLDRAVVLPTGVAVERGGERVVFFVDGGRARAISVAQATPDGHHLVLEQELPYRELVVRGQRDLRDGALVRVDNTVLAELGDGTSGRVPTAEPRVSP